MFSILSSILIFHAENAGASSANVEFRGVVMSQERMMLLERQEISVFGEQAGVRVSVRNRTGNSSRISFAVHDEMYNLVPARVHGRSDIMDAHSSEHFVLIWSVAQTRVQYFRICTALNGSETQDGKIDCSRVKVRQLKD